MFSGVSGVNGSALREAQYINKRYVGVHSHVVVVSVASFILQAFIAPPAYLTASDESLVMKAAGN